MKMTNLAINNKPSMNLHKTIVTIIAAMLLLPSLSQGQQMPTFNQYLYQSELYNPAMLGGKNGNNLNLNYRTGWLGFEDAPRSLLMNVGGSPLKNNKNMGIGLKLISDNAGAGVSRTNVHFQYAYHLLNDKTNSLSLGLGAGIIMQNINSSKLEASDPNILKPTMNFANFDASAGLNYAYTGDGFGVHLGAAVEQIPGRSKKDSFLVGDIKMNPRLLASIGANFNATDMLSIAPEVLFKSKIGGETEGGGNIELGVKIDYNDLVWLGIGARPNNNSSFHLSLGVNPTIGDQGNKVNIFSSFELNSALGTTLEVGLGYKFGQEKPTPKPKPEPAPKTEKPESEDPAAIRQAEREAKAAEKYKQEQLKVKLAKEEAERKREEARLKALEKEQGIAAKNAEKERLEKLKKERLAKAEAAKLAKDKTEAERLAKVEEAKKAKDKAEAERIAAEKAADAANPCKDVATRVPDWLRENKMANDLKALKLDNGFSSASYKSTASDVDLIYSFSDEEDPYVVTSDIGRMLDELTETIADGLDQCKQPKLLDVRYITFNSELTETKEDLNFDADIEFTGVTKQVTYNIGGQQFTKSIAPGTITNEQLAVLKLVYLRDALVKRLSTQGIKLSPSAIRLLLTPGKEENEYSRTTSVIVKMQKDEE